MTQGEAPQTGVAPILTVSDANAAIDFYKRAFGAVEVKRYTAPDGRKLLHAQLEINGDLVMISDDFPEFTEGNSFTPESFGGSPVTIHMQLADVDAMWQRAVEAGATVTMPLQNQFWGDRYGELTDPFGHRWSLGQEIERLSEEEIADRTRQMFGQPS